MIAKADIFVTTKGQSVNSQSSMGALYFLHVGADDFDSLIWLCQSMSLILVGRNAHGFIVRYKQARSSWKEFPQCSDGLSHQQVPIDRATSLHRQRRSWRYGHKG